MDLKGGMRWIESFIAYKLSAGFYGFVKEELLMATIQQYKKSDGTTAWLYKVYMGKDPVTGKENGQHVGDSKQKKKPL